MTGQSLSAVALKRSLRASTSHSAARDASRYVPALRSPLPNQPSGRFGRPVKARQTRVNKANKATNTTPPTKNAKTNERT